MEVNKVANDYISQVTLPNNTTYDFKDQNLKLYTGSCSTAAGTAIKDVTTDGAFTLAKGAVIFVNFSVTNTAAVGNLKLKINGEADANAKPIKYLVNGNDPANIPGAGYLRANQTYMFRYDGTNWVADLNYYTYSNDFANKIGHYNNILARKAIAAESLIVGDATGYEKVASGVTFNLAYPIVWCTANISANASNYANMFLQHYDRNIATGAKNGFTSSANKVIYLVVTINGNIATIDSNIITDTLPSSEDGKVYIVLGKLGNQSTGADYFFLYPIHPMFEYKGGMIRIYNSGITSVTISATSPVQSSTSTTQTGSSASTTISLKDAYGDTKNPYGSKTKNYVLAAPSNANGTPSFRALVAADIPDLSWNKITSDKPTTLSDYGITDAASSNHSHILKIGNKSLSVSTSEQTWSVHDILLNSTSIGTNTSWDQTTPGTYLVSSTGGSAFTGAGHPGTDQEAPYTYGGLYVLRAGDGGAAQIYISHHASSAKNAANGIRYRSGWDVTNAEKTAAQRWEAWATILDDKNYSLFAWKRPASITEGEVLVSSGTNGTTTTRAILNMTTQGALGYNSGGVNNANNLRFMTVNTLAYWNGAYSGTNSNLSVLGTITTGTWHGTKIANDYIANPKIIIANNEVSLGGSLAASTLIESLGLSKAMRFIGVATNTITDSGTQDPGISGYSTKTAGDVVIDSTSSREYVWSTTGKWELLGGDSSYKTTQTAVTDPTASTSTSTTFIDTISQNANGVISATKKTLPTASTEVAGIIKIGTGSTNAMAGDTTVTNVSYTATTDNYEYPVLMKNSTGSDTTAAGVRFASGTNQQVTINPSTGTVSTRRLVINNSSSNGTVPDLVFSRTSWSYINIPDNDAAVLAIGRGTGDNASQKLIIQGDGVVRPGSDNTQVLGKSTRRWKEVHGVNFYGTFNGTATYSQGLAKWAISNSDLNNFVSNGALRYSWEGGNNGFESKPTDVNAFGVIAMKTAASWTGQILMSTDSEPGLYWRTNLTTETPSYGSWTPLASGNGGVYYGTCSTAADVVEKVVNCKHYHTLKAGDIIVVTFDNSNTQAQPTLNVNNTGAVGVKMAYSGGIVDLGSTTQLSYTCTFIYNGANWLIINQQNAIQIATASNQTNWRSILLSNSNDGDENFTPSANTLGRTYAAHNVKYQPSTGTLRAPIMKTPKVQIEYNHVNKAHIQWNDTDSSIDFIFD